MNLDVFLSLFSLMLISLAVFMLSQKLKLPYTVLLVIAGSLLVFIPAVGEFVIPDLLGGPDNLMVGRLLWTEFFSNHDWPVASALAVIMLLLLLIPIIFMLRTEQREIS